MVLLAPWAAPGRGTRVVWPQTRSDRAVLSLRARSGRRARHRDAGPSGARRCPALTRRGPGGQPAEGLNGPFAPLALEAPRPDVAPPWQPAETRSPLIAQLT